MALAQLGVLKSQSQAAKLWLLGGLEQFFWQWENYFNMAILYI
jgi:hypothetical protein